MAEELVMQVRWPIADLEAMARKKYGIQQTLSDYRVEGDSFVLYFTPAQSDNPLSETPVAAEKKVERTVGPTKARSTSSGKVRRRSGKRNRMRTRGWDVVASFVNSKGQRCTIYKPFVDALKGSNRSTEVRRAKVREILKSNGNKPSDASIEYFLENTIQYLQKEGQLNDS